MNEYIPVVSVMMGVYNCGDKELLKKSIDSILNQTFENFEFLICDDGSTDDTFQVLEMKKNQDLRIKLIRHKENLGLNNALNSCIKIARGKYLARQDDDDFSISIRLEEQVKFLENNPGYAIVGSVAEIYDKRGKWGYFHVPEEPRCKHFLWNSPFIHPSTMMRKEAINEVNGYRIAKETRRCEDYDLFMRMYAKGYRGYNIQKILYRYKMENNPSIRHRKFNVRVDEAVVRLKGYWQMRILYIGWPFVFKPILLGLIPQHVMYFIKKTQY